MTDLSLPQQYSRTRRFTLGAPRTATPTPTGDGVVFLRSRGGQDPVTCLWLLDVASGAERLVADPALLVEDDVPEHERRRRERARESAGGIVAYATDTAMDLVAFALGGQVLCTRLSDPGGVVATLPAVTPAIDPRPDPTGTWVAYVADGALRVVAVDGAAERVVAAPDGPQVTYGLAEFVAAEEMGRARGYWWSPDGSHLLVARVDESRVQRWYIADPANPAAEPLRWPTPSPAARTPR